MKNSMHQRRGQRAGERSSLDLWALTATAGAVTLLLAAGAAQAQQAQADTAAGAQTVVVTGIRKGIEDAISVKKNSESIVEAISAEDIGKLPDASVAESISRLPGVTSQRSFVTGRSQNVSVRGFGPDFNGGLLNGREQASTGSSRAVEFDQYPAELLANIVIYKTPDAAVIGQGLSSTIDMQTVRPLSFAKRAVAVNYRKEKTTKAENAPGYSEGDGDRVSLSYVDQFADRTLGVALGLTKSKSEGGTRPFFRTWGGWVPEVDYDHDNNATTAPIKVKTPGGFTTDLESTNFKREAAMAVLQFKPNKNFESVLDVFYSKGEFSNRKRGLEGPVGGLSAGANDSGGTLTNATIEGDVATSGTFTNWRGVIRNHNEDYTDKLESVGWANKLTVGDWRLNTDLSYSKVKKDATRFETTAGLPGDVNNPNDTITFSGFNGSNLDQVHYTTGLNYADPSLIKLTDVQGWAGATGVQDGYYANPVTTDKITALRLGAGRDMDLGPVKGFDFGANFSKREKERVTREGALIVPGALDANGNVINRFAAADMPGASAGVGGTTGIPVLTWNPAGSLGSVYQLNPWSDADIVAKSWGVEEKVTTGFVKGSLDGDVFGLPLRGNVGLQVQNTKQTATGYSVAGGCDGGTHTCPYTPYSAGHNYTDLLPSANLIFDLGGDQVVRLGAGRVLARADMEDMRGSINVTLNNNTDGNGVRLTASGGNPKLEPFRANALDLSYEKYFGRKGYVSVAGFYKKISTYILRVTTPGVELAPFVTPSTSLPPSGSTVGDLTQPRNGTGGNVKGIELAINLPLNMMTSYLDGFGIVLNHSHTTSSIKLATAGVDVQNIGVTEIPLPGLSKDVTNLRFYYENYGFQIAAAVRKRSQYLGSVSDYQDKTQLVFIRPETTVDMQVSYEFSSGPMKGLSLLLQGSNLTNEKFDQFDPATGQITETKKFGKSYLAGLNYKF
ncbi:TonB-dependent receptor [Ideonella sp. BN130291]|uniref:TonB-dependent receptor n=1 Tax=Ideonella sp. BN130291 TaxID=3112940 RepID=UPI002E26EBDE|nr:TonB-dependent receptor [Ideonella sp. BN130291]